MRHSMVSWLCRACALGVLHYAAFAATVAHTHPGHAAALEWSAPTICAPRSEVVAEVERLIERPLAEVEALRFTVRVSERSSGFELRLETVESNGKHASRTLTAAECSELTQAAAIAIALAIRARESDNEVPALAPPLGSQPPAATRPLPSDLSDASTPAREPRLGPPSRAQEEHGRSSLRQESSAATTRMPRLGARLGLAALADTGSLPGFGPGAEFEASLMYGNWRLMGAAALLASREVRRSDGSGGDFQMFFGALLLCSERRLSAELALIGCGGAELGRLSARGFGVTDPEVGSSAWRALRFEVGVGWATSGKVLVFLRAGASVPFVRPEFVLGGSDRLHQANSLAGRALAGIEFGL